ncbi:hypothetical protein ACU686_21665 [Yinghuangia aomiensis]
MDDIKIAAVDPVMVMQSQAMGLGKGPPTVVVLDDSGKEKFRLQDHPVINPPGTSISATAPALATDKVGVRAGQRHVRLHGDRRLGRQPDHRL